MANIAEGFERSSDKEFERFLYIAKGAAGEVGSHRYVALELGFLPAQDLDCLNAASEATARAIQGVISYLQGSITDQGEISLERAPIFDILRLGPVKLPLYDFRPFTF